MPRSRRKRGKKLATVTYDEYDGAIRVGKDGSFGWSPLGEPFGSLDDVGDASLTQLRDALQRAGAMTFAVSTDRAELFDPEYASADDTEFEFKSGKLFTKIESWLGGHNESDDALEGLITHYLRERRSILEFCEFYTYSGDTWVSLTYVSPYYNRSLREVAVLAHDVKALLSAAVTGSITPSSGLALILGGHAAALVGLYENAWLEAKRAPYDLQDKTQGLELALDVAALANSEDGGLLVIGLITKKDQAGDRIVKVAPTKLDLISARNYRLLLDRLVYPAIAGLKVHVIKHGPAGHGLLAIEVPAQPEQLKPFLVSGTLIEGSVRGAYFTLATRRGDARAAASPAEIHGLLAAGRLATRLNSRG